MKHLKLLTIAAMATAALMEFAGPASATTLTSPAGTEYTGSMNATANSSLLLRAGFADITCTESLVSINVESNGGATAGGVSSTLSFGNCGGAKMDVDVNGSFEVEKFGSGKGTVRGSGTKVTVEFLGVPCAYGTTSNTILGTLTGGTPAKITINANLPKLTGGFLCVNPAAWSGNYTVTTPSTLLVD